MIDRLFVYGTLAPGRPNEHILADVPGQWQPATVRGHLRNEGWGAVAGCPGIVPDEAGQAVSGLIFSSPALAAHWARLDEFEGSEYRRMTVPALLDDGTVVQAQVYALASGTVPDRP